MTWIGYIEADALHSFRSLRQAGGSADLTCFAHKRPEMPKLSKIEGDAQVV